MTDTNFLVPRTPNSAIVAEVGKYMRFSLQYLPPREAPLKTSWEAELDYPGVAATIWLAAKDQMIHPLLQGCDDTKVHIHSTWGIAGDPGQSPPLPPDEPSVLSWRHLTRQFWAQTLRESEREAQEWVDEVADRVHAALTRRRDRLQQRAGRIEYAHANSGTVKFPFIGVDIGRLATPTDSERVLIESRERMRAAAGSLSGTEELRVRGNPLRITAHADPDSFSGGPAVEPKRIRVAWSIDVDPHELAVEPGGCSNLRYAWYVAKQVQAQYFQAPRDSRWTFEVKVGDTTCVVDLLAETVYDINPKLA